MPWNLNRATFDILQDRIVTRVAALHPAFIGERYRILGEVPPQRRMSLYERGRWYQAVNLRTGRHIEIERSAFTMEE